MVMLALFSAHKEQATHTVWPCLCGWLAFYLKGMIIVDEAYGVWPVSHDFQ